MVQLHVGYRWYYKALVVFSTVVFEEEDESSDTEEFGLPADSISRGYSICNSHDPRQKLRFEVISTRICVEGHKKHVVSSSVKQ